MIAVVSLADVPGQSRPDRPPSESEQSDFQTPVRKGDEGPEESGSDHRSSDDGGFVRPYVPGERRTERTS